MKAWVVESYEVGRAHLKTDWPEPEPGQGQARIQVEAAGLNFLDTLMLRGQYQVRPPVPVVPGVEAVGTVEAVGPECRLKVGQRVVGWLPTFGGFAEKTLVQGATAIPLPPDLDAGLALTLPIIFPTAHIALKLIGRIKEGDRVLIHAGAGAVGSAAIQLAKLWGATVYATAGAEAKLQICRELGADHAFNYRGEDWVEAMKAATEGRGVDLVVDMVGDPATTGSLKLLAFGGRLMIVGFAGNSIPKIEANRLLLKQTSVNGVYWGEYAQRRPGEAMAVLAECVQLISSGRIKPLVRQRFAFEKADEALAVLATRGSVGKVVLEMKPAA